MSVRQSRKQAVVLPVGLNPNYRAVVETYCKPTGIEVRHVESNFGRIDLEKLADSAGGAGVVVVQQPNFFGLLEPVAKAARIAHDAGALVVSSTYPMSLALLKPPGEWGADIATAEGQSFGIPMSFGGPYVGLFAVRRAFIRQMPGRLVARAKDTEGRSGFVLTLQTREQHIRREKATSNICSNQALMALSSLVYLSLVGRDGLKRTALDSYRRAHYLAGRLGALDGCAIRYSDEFFNELVLDLPLPAGKVVRKLARKGIFAGPQLGKWYPEMGNSILIAVTEKRTREDLDRFVNILAEVIKD